MLWKKVCEENSLNNNKIHVNHIS